MKKTLMSLAAAASVAALPVLAQAAGETSGGTSGASATGQQMQGQQQPGQQQAQQQQGQQQDMAMQGRRAVIGEITDMRQVKVQGAQAPHQLVVLQNDRKERLVVDLGVLDQQQAQQYQKGDRIVAIGKEARINGDPVLHARFVGELHPVGKTTPPQASAS